LMSIEGLTFEEAWPKRVESDLGGVEASFISREDLIRSKRATGRHQVLLDAELLAQSDRANEPPK